MNKEQREALADGLEYFAYLHRGWRGSVERLHSEMKRREAYPPEIDSLVDVQRLRALLLHEKVPVWGRNVAAWIGDDGLVRLAHHGEPWQDEPTEPLQCAVCGVDEGQPHSADGAVNGRAEMEQVRSAGVWVHKNCRSAYWARRRALEAEGQAA